MLRFIKIIVVLLVLPVAAKAEDPLSNRHSLQVMLKGEILGSGPIFDDNSNPINYSAFYHVLMLDSDAIVESNYIIKEAIYICEVIGKCDTEYNDCTTCTRASVIR
jgi:hypothetical protein